MHSVVPLVNICFGCSEMGGALANGLGTHAPEQVHNHTAHDDGGGDADADDERDADDGGGDDVDEDDNVDGYAGADEVADGGGDE
eukprot:565486-Pyramimonas_sp.AAC.1